MLDRREQMERAGRVEKVDPTQKSSVSFEKNETPSNNSKNWKKKTQDKNPKSRATDCRKKSMENSQWNISLFLPTPTWSPWSNYHDLNLNQWFDQVTQDKNPKSRATDCRKKSMENSQWNISLFLPTPTWSPWSNYHDLNLNQWFDQVDLHHLCTQKKASKSEKWAKPTKVTMVYPYCSDEDSVGKNLAKTPLGKHQTRDMHVRVITSYHQSLQNSKKANYFKRGQ